ncbi:hypothetical protein B4U79_06754 [Dinothrombium tinctorium]|nr:hypothetical protein B4U79_08289 [Dinothrombium tinctorium]RWS16851.1 hypothetical protein B4U79_06754 [Dinothrombium tinctorium]
MSEETVLKRKDNLSDHESEASRKKEKVNHSFEVLFDDSEDENDLREESDSQKENREANKCDFFGLPPQVKHILTEKRNIHNLYEWQKELMLELNSNYRNVVYSLPTSGGKTLVAELMILKELLLNSKNALLILPYVSIVQEKIRQLSPFASEFNFLMEEYAGPKGVIPPKMRRKFK